MSLAGQVSRNESEGVPVKLGIPASDDELAQHFQHVAFTDPSLTPTDLRTATLKKAEAIRASSKPTVTLLSTCFKWKSARIQIASTARDISFHCISLPHEVFDSLHFLPLPLLGSTKQHYTKFSDHYGEDPSDVDRPIREPTSSDQAKEVDKARKGLLVCGKVRGVIVCTECCKPRRIWHMSKYNKFQGCKMKTYTPMVPRCFLPTHHTRPLLL